MSIQIRELIIRAEINPVKQEPDRPSGEAAASIPEPRQSADHPADIGAEFNNLRRER